jgi:hypothetical protein
MTKLVAANTSQNLAPFAALREMRRILWISVFQTLVAALLPCTDHYPKQFQELISR